MKIYAHGHERDSMAKIFLWVKGSNAAMKTVLAWMESGKIRPLEREGSGSFRRTWKRNIMDRDQGMGKSSPCQSPGNNSFWQTMLPGILIVSGVTTGDGFTKTCNLQNQNLGCRENSRRTELIIL